MRSADVYTLSLSPRGTRKIKIDSNEDKIKMLAWKVNIGIENKPGFCRLSLNPLGINSKVDKQYRAVDVPKMFQIVVS
jgi:hypothetical protein